MIELTKAAILAGLGLWLAIAFLNNIVAFRNGTAAIGSLMGMRLFDEQPTLKTPLTGRRITARGWHMAVYSFVLLVEAATAALLLSASVLQASAFLGQAHVLATPLSNVAVAAFLGLASLMIVGGAWFAYYIKQEAAQLTHLVMLGIGTAAAVLVNTPVS